MIAEAVLAMVCYTAAACMLVGVVLFVLDVVEMRRRYRYDRNPWRRWCNACGQQQDAYHLAGHPDGPRWWETMGRIRNPSCSCHKDAT